MIRILLACLLIIILMIVSMQHNYENFKFKFSKEGTSFGKDEQNIHDKIISHQKYSMEKRQQTRDKNNLKKDTKNLSEIKQTFNEIQDTINELRINYKSIPRCSNTDINPFPDKMWNGTSEEQLFNGSNKPQTSEYQLLQNYNSGTTTYTSCDNVNAEKYCTIDIDTVPMDIPNLNYFCNLKSKKSTESIDDAKTACTTGEYGNYCNYNDSTNKCEVKLNKIISGNNKCYTITPTSGEPSKFKVKLPQRYYIIND